MNEKLDAILNVLFIFAELVIVMFNITSLIFNQSRISRKNPPSVVDAMLRVLISFFSYELMLVFWDGFTEFHPNAEIRDGLHVPLLIMITMIGGFSLFIIFLLGLAESMRMRNDNSHKDHPNAYLSQFILIEGESFDRLRRALWVVAVCNALQIPIYCIDRYCEWEGWFPSLSMFTVLVVILGIPQSIAIYRFDISNARRLIKLPHIEKPTRVHNGDIPESISGSDD